MKQGQKQGPGICLLTVANMVSSSGAKEHWALSTQEEGGTDELRFEWPVLCPALWQGDEEQRQPPATRGSRQKATEIQSLIKGTCFLSMFPPIFDSALTVLHATVTEIWLALNLRRLSWTMPGHSSDVIAFALDPKFEGEGALQPHPLHHLLTRT